MPGTTTLSEAESKALLAPFGVPFAPERVVADAFDAVAAAAELGGPVAIKLNGDAIAHKTERGLVRLGVSGDDAVAWAAAELLSAATPADGEVGLLVAPMVRGSRELLCGLALDPQFGMTVVVGVGGVLAEAVADVSVRLAPISRADAHEMLDELRLSALLGPFRGEPAVDREAVVDCLVALSDLAAARPDVVSVDLNPLIVSAVDGRPIAVDALVELDPTGSVVREGSVRNPLARQNRGGRDEGMSALFEPKGVIVAGASTHPGKFGFVSLHNLLAGGYEGAVFATNLDGASVLGVDTVPSVDDLADGAADLVFVCTPAAANIELLEACARKGVRAAFLTSAGYGEAGDDGRAREAELVATCERLGILLAGPNGQGVISTPAKLCAQIVAPNPPPGAIAVASQSGNLVSSFMNLASVSGIGISRGISAGNAAATGVADYLRWFATDDATKVALAYVEGIPDGRDLVDAIATVATRKPVVIVKGGATAGGARAASSHTGSLATDDRVVDGALRQAGAIRATTVEEAFDAAATFATQPAPAGDRVVVMTTAGGWGVIAADAISRTDSLTLVALPDDLLAAIDEHLPPRWSRNNPVDLAGGETRDTIPEVMRLVAEHPGVDSIVYLGLGIQANQASLMANGPYYPEFGTERIVDFHRRQDARYATAAAEISDATGKPILVATELAVADPDNPGPAAVRATGRLCYPSAERAVAALAHLTRDAARRRAAATGGSA